MSITLLVCKMSAIVRYFEHSLALPFVGIGIKTDLSSPGAIAEFSKFAGILSVALSQHHILGFEIAQLGIPPPPLALFVVMPPNAHHLTWHFMMSGSR